jgi:hypothetical protein
VAATPRGNRGVGAGSRRRPITTHVCYFVSNPVISNRVLFGLVSEKWVIHQPSRLVFSPNGFDQQAADRSGRIPSTLPLQISKTETLIGCKSNVSRGHFFQNFSITAATNPRTSADDWKVINLNRTVFVTSAATFSITCYFSFLGQGSQLGCDSYPSTFHHLRCYQIDDR